MTNTVNITEKIKLTIVEGSLAIGGVQKLTVDQMRLLDKDLFDIQLIQTYYKQTTYTNKS